MSHSRHLTFRADPKFEVLRIDKWERFGNSALQIRNVIHVAEGLGIRAIEFPGEHACFAGDHIGPIALSWGVPAANGRAGNRRTILRTERVSPSLGCGERCPNFRRLRPGIGQA